MTTDSAADDDDTRKIVAEIRQALGDMVVGFRHLEDQRRWRRLAKAVKR
jgi:hypothetical protein